MGEDALVRKHGGIVTFAEAIAAGWTRNGVGWAVSAGRLVRLRHGVCTSARNWSVADQKQRERLVLRAYQRLDPRLIGCGLSASRALGLPLPAELSENALGVKPHLRRRGDDEAAVVIRGGPALAAIGCIVVDCARRLPRAWGLAVAGCSGREVGVRWIWRAVATAGDPYRERICASGPVRS